MTNEGRAEIRMLDPLPKRVVAKIIEAMTPKLITKPPRRIASDEDFLELTKNQGLKQC